jgi:eukaryotic-like serine/threonine-protein kinase
VPVHTQGSLLDGRYRVIRHLGSGGMASVLLCEDERLGRQVAVKRLHADSPVDVEQRFAREAKLGASLNHPNLVSVFDTATDDEGVLIVMEYVDGQPLSRLLRRGPMRPEAVSRMVTELGSALDHAHSQGVIHRDVKPGNVLIRNDGVTKLADLGIATASDGTRITRSGTVLGTAAYMAPEQLEGRETGPATDIYALAAIAFEALGGRKPREGRTPVEIAHKIVTEPPPDLREAWPYAPQAAAEVLQRGMALDPGDRPASAGQLARELAGALGEEPDRTAPTRRVAAAGGPADVATAGRPSGPPPTGPAIRRGSSRQRPSTAAMVLALLFIALAAATIAGAVLSSGGNDDGSPQADRTPADPATPDKAKKQKKEPKAKKEPKREEPPAQQPAAPAPSGDGQYDPARGAELNNQGFALMNQGSYDEAIPVLQQAVDSFPPGTSDVNYAYALFNLGKSLRLGGRPDEAIPVLERRLQIPNQTETVQRELDLARRQAKES